MALRRTQIGQTHVLSVAGDIDLGSLPKFTDALLRLVSDSPGCTVAVDLDGSGLVDDAALGLFLGAAGRARHGGGDLIVVSSEKRLRHRLTETGFDRAVTVSDSIVER